MKFIVLVVSLLIVGCSTASPINQLVTHPGSMSSDVPSFTFRSSYLYPPKSSKYRQIMHNTEKKAGLPMYMLIEVAYLESRYRIDVITCKRVSAAGAKGLMQIIPKYHPLVNPCNAHDSIIYAGAYLRYLYNQTGSWYYALAAYNYGIGNVRKVIKGEKKMPFSVDRYAMTILENIGFVLT